MRVILRVVGVAIAALVLLGGLIIFTSPEYAGWKESINTNPTGVTSHIFYNPEKGCEVSWNDSGAFKAYWDFSSLSLTIQYRDEYHQVHQLAVVVYPTNLDERLNVSSYGWKPDANDQHDLRQHAKLVCYEAIKRDLPLHPRVRGAVIAAFNN